MNKEEIDYGLAIEDLHKPNGLRELAKIQLDKMVENSREQYIKSLQQENKQLKDNWNKLEDDLWNLRNIAFTKEFGNEWNNCLSFNEDVLPIINKMLELEKGDSNE